MLIACHLEVCACPDYFFQISESDFFYIIIRKLSKDKSTDDRKAREVTSSQAAALSRPGEADEMIRRDGKADKLIKEEKPKKSEKKDRERGKEKEERGGKDKSKRSHSQEPEEERTTAVSSSYSSSHRRSIEASPLAVDDRGNIV